MSDEPTPTIPGAFGLRHVLGAITSALFLPLFFLIFGSAPSCMGFDEPTLRAIEACPQATAILGSPVSEGWMGLSCGNAKTVNDHGRASWTFPVTGPRGSGSVDVQARRRNGVWTLQRGILTTDQGTVDIVNCTAAGAGGTISAVTRTGSVTSVIGQAGVAVGDACTVSVIPTGESQNCRVEVRCGSAALYGATQSTGWLNCGLDATGAVVAHDTDPTPNGGDPTLDLRLGEHTVVITDQTQAGSWAVQLSTQ
ncbi:MAG: cytochrome c oxidase assembly factor 1 family protein [Sandaracinaceae bacterium]|nr:cytochrome c oxidase assembly factor 1 family protein [Sandaracinaceae bacterium]